VIARCGAPLVAVRGGRVRRAGFDPVLYGNNVLIHGEGEHRSYFYAHLRRAAAVHRGERVFTGERIGAVGATGNARTVGCHLHFEIHVGGRPIDPEPGLRRWDAEDDRRAIARNGQLAESRASRMKSDFASE
jgi:murein DD-endopeptidase MepM/ murein hydrolase activator NlpD